MIKLNRLKELAAKEGLKAGVDAYSEAKNKTEAMVEEACANARKAGDPILKAKHFEEA